jgi:hypothetical protein
MLKEDPILGGASFWVGKARVWPKKVLDNWLKAQTQSKSDVLKQKPA